MNITRLVLSASTLIAITGLVPASAAVAADPYANGCVDCHIVYKDKGLDERLSVALKQWTAGKVDPGLLAKAKASAPAGLTLKGKHPDATDSLDDVPTACLDCHASTSKKAPPFTRLIHLVHLTGGARNNFVTVFKGDCTHCHKLDSKTGEWSLPSGPEK